MENATESANKQAAEAGSPYRWEHSSSGEFSMLTKTIVGVVGITSADSVLEKKTQILVSEIENKRPIKPKQKPYEIRQVSGSTVRVEGVWVYESGEDKQAFVVVYIPSPDGGTDIKITGPWCCH